MAARPVFGMQLLHEMLNTEYKAQKSKYRIQ